MAFRRLGDLIGRYIGIGGATGDATNPLSVRGAGALFDGDSGGHQVRINKSGVSDTASFLFQRGFSGRAEFGLIGNDNFELKVSDDGSTFRQAWVIDDTTGVTDFKQEPTYLGQGLWHTGDFQISDYMPLAGGDFSGDVSFAYSAATLSFGGAGFSGPYGLQYNDGLGNPGVYVRYRTTPNALEIEDGSEQDLLVFPQSRATGVEAFGNWDWNSYNITGVAQLGVGGATPDATNKLSINTTAALFNNDGTDIRLTLNKNAVGDDATLTFQDAFSTKAQMGLSGNDDFTIKVGSSFTTAVSIAETTGVVSFPEGIQVGSGGETVNSIAETAAAGSTLGLEQNLLAAQGQVGKAVLAVGYVYHQGDAEGTSNMKAQITSLGAGNVVFVYANGDDFNAGTVQEGPIFLNQGEIYVIENCYNGTIITATEGAYGFSQQRNGYNVSPMPLLSLALGFKDTFFYGFRNCQTYVGDVGGGTSHQEGWIHVVAGPLPAKVTLRTGAGAVVQGQQDIDVPAWGYKRFYTSGNQEYRLSATNTIMACHNAAMDSTPQFYDSRLILPVTNDGITWPRSGQVSAPYSGTVVDYYVNDDAEGQFTVSPGTPVDFDGTTGATDQDYEPQGATRVRAVGLISAYSGGDSSGLEASPLCPVSTFTQRIALPLHIRKSGDGGNNGIALASIYKGKARLYQWNQVTFQAELFQVKEPGTGTLVDEILIERRVGAVEQGDAPDRAAQLHPAAALISEASSSATGDPNAYGLPSDFNGGYIEVDVPCTCVFNAEQNENGAVDHTFKGTSGSAVVGIHSDDDEQLTYGITPDTIRAEITEGADGRLYKRVIATGGTETWEVA